MSFELLADPTRGADMPSPRTVEVCSERLQSGPGWGPPAGPRLRRPALPQGHAGTTSGPVQVFRLVQPPAAAFGQYNAD